MKTKTMTIQELRELASDTESCDTGNCYTCDDYLGSAPYGYCKTGNDVHRACCCFHSGYREQKAVDARKMLRDHCEKMHGPLLEALKELADTFEGVVSSYDVPPHTSLFAEVDGIIEDAETVEVPV